MRFSQHSVDDLLDKYFDKHVILYHHDVLEYGEVITVKGIRDKKEHEFLIKPSDYKSGFVCLADIEDVLENALGVKPIKEQKEDKPALGVIETLEARIAELEKHLGYCSTCKRFIKDWKPVFGTFAPEWWETQRENGINPATGHLLTCGK